MPESCASTCRWIRDERLRFLHARCGAVEHQWPGIGDRWCLGERRGGASKGDGAIRALSVRSLERLGNNAAKWARLRNA